MTDYEQIARDALEALQLMAELTLAYSDPRAGWTERQKERNREYLRIEMERWRALSASLESEKNDWPRIQH